MRKIYNWYINLSRRIRDSITASVTAVGLISTIFSVLDISLGNLKNLNIWMRIGIVFVSFGVICSIIYFIIGIVYRDSVNFTIRKTQVAISCGDIFEASGWKIIGCDTHFDTRVDDVIISKKSLHGQLVLNHGKKEEIEAVVENEAKRLGLQKKKGGLYDFPQGTVIRYDSSVDNQTYLMLAMTELNIQHEAHTNMAKFELMLMKMWAEIDRVYASHDIVLPVLGTGISRFDDGPKDREALLRCMLCTLNSSGVSLKSKVGIIIYGNVKDIPMYEYKNMFHMTLRR
jgi:hypothetical protein